jgi:hypothetical protein
MRKLILLGLAVLLTGCLGAEKKLQKDGKWTGIAPVESRLWWQNDTAGLEKDKNPWEKFNKTCPAAKWHDPWSQVDMTELGVTPIEPTKPIEYRIIKTTPKTRIIVVPDDEFPHFYKKFFKKDFLKKNRSMKHPKQDKLIPPPRSSKEI